MKIEMRIAPRCSGKTKHLIEEFLREDEEAYYVATSKAEIIDKMKKCGITDKKYFDRVMTVDSFITNYIGKTIKKLYLDEWLIFNDESQRTLYNIIRNILSPCGLEEIIIATTSDKIYNKSEIDNMRLARKTYKDGVKQFYLTLRKQNLIDKTLFYNFLGDDDCLIHNETVIPLYNDETISLEASYENREKYLTERCGVFCK